MSLSPVELKKHMERRRKGLANLRKPWETGNEEVARSTLRWLSPYVARKSSGRGQVASADGSQPYVSGQPNNRLYNSTATQCASILANGMASGMSSPSSTWFAFQPADRDLRKNHAVKVWVDEVTGIVTRFLSQTNIYHAMQQGYGELGVFGTEATLFTPHWQYGGVAHCLTWGQYWLGSDDGLRIDTLIRDVPMTVGQVCQMVGSKAEAKKKLSQTSRKLLDDGKFDSVIPIRHMIEPNLDRVFGKVDAVNKAFRSAYWEPNADDGRANDGEVLRLSGFDRKPFATPRWETVDLNPYGFGPGFNAMPESRKAQLQEIRLQTVIDYVARPPLQAPVTSRNDGGMNLLPGGVSYTSTTDLNSGAREVWKTDPSAINYIAQDITNRTEPAIRAAFHAPLFQAITGIPGTQPRTAEEIARRHEENLAQLGPVVDRVQTEKLSVIVLQAFSMCADLGLLPPVPDELDGQEIAIEFVSVLAQAMRMIGLSTMERGVAFVGNVAGVQATVLDVVDFDEMTREYFDRLGVPAKTLNSIEAVAAKREQDAAAQQNERIAASMAPMKDGADALRLLTEAGAGGQAAVNALMPGV